MNVAVFRLLRWRLLWCEVLRLIVFFSHTPVWEVVMGGIVIGVDTTKMWCVVLYCGVVLLNVLC